MQAQRSQLPSHAPTVAAGSAAQTRPWPVSHGRQGRLVGSGDDLDHVVPAGPAAARQPGAAGGGRQRSGPGAVRGRPGCCGAAPGRRDGPGWPRPCGRSTSRWAVGCASGSGDPLVGRAADGRSRGRGRAGARDQRLHALRPGARHARSSRRCRATSQGVATGTPYAVAPGTVTERVGQALQGVHAVQQGLARARLGRPRPGAAQRRVGHADNDKRVARDARQGACARHPPGCRRRARTPRCVGSASFLDRDVDEYDETRNDPGADRTSRLSPYLKYGVLHPRQLLADDGRRAQRRGATTFETELAWRDFYADVLFHQPAARRGRTCNRVAGLTYDEPQDAIEAWKQGTTGFPIVDAGMRQLLSEGWMHNRVRMITASFLTKDLHVWWPVGARHFLDHLVDGDLASNNHGWQWVAGTGTDAAPYFRVFNPVTQGLKFDPAGRLRPALGARAGPPARARRRTSRGTPTTATPTATRSGSSTTRRSVSGRWTATSAAEAEGLDDLVAGAGCVGPRRGTTRPGRSRRRSSWGRRRRRAAARTASPRPAGLIRASVRCGLNRWPSTSAPDFARRPVRRWPLRRSSSASVSTPA